MHPVLFSIGSAELRSYTVLSVLAMFAAMIAVRSEAKRLGWDLRSVSWLVARCTLYGFIGAHILYAFTRWDLPWNSWWPLFYNFGYGFVWFGGFLVSWVHCQFYAKKHSIPTLQMWDVAAFAVLMAQSVGRIGCLLEGCCYGARTTLPWGMQLDTAEWGPAIVHPAPLYELLYQLSLFTAFWMLRKKNSRDGLTAARYLIFAPLGRFAIEFVRGDSVRGFVLGSWMSTSQLLALALVAAGVSLYARLKATTVQVS